MFSCVYAVVEFVVTAAINDIMKNVIDALYRVSIAVIEFVANFIDPWSEYIYWGATILLLVFIGVVMTMFGNARALMYIAFMLAVGTAFIGFGSTIHYISYSIRWTQLIITQFPTISSMIILGVLAFGPAVVEIAVKFVLFSALPTVMKTTVVIPAKWLTATYWKKRIPAAITDASALITARGPHLFGSRITLLSSLYMGCLSHQIILFR